jgi:hypothetical protein
MELPQRYNVPTYGYIPEHGSHGVPPRQSPYHAVGATSLQGGGYPGLNDLPSKVLNPTQQANAIRLIVATFGYGSQEVIGGILGQEVKDKCKTAVSNAASQRLKARPSNPMYHMIQEEVENYNLGVHIRSMARVAVASRAAGEIEKADEFQAASLELRDRAIAQIDRVKYSRAYRGGHAQALTSRLKAVRNKIDVDPFVGLAPTVERVYFRLETEERRQFWLDRYDEHVVGWYWPYRGLIDIEATIAAEPMKTYSREEFAFVCDAMWDIVIAPDVERAFLAQSGSVALRGTNAYVVTTADYDRYRERIGEFNRIFNAEHPDGRVDSLSVIRVQKHSINRANGQSSSATQHYIVHV